ncbi:MAG TPA: Hsp20/alpha crystallin family protein [Armatimonadetes bacterium]|jgi:HSP20 family molecular chaperone IbpA|nr:Hsp20/alpha crystallin family protein [Armatimonadota bacterium]
MSFTRYEDVIRQMEKEMERLTEGWRGFFDPMPVPGRFWQPRTDVYETERNLVVKVEAAGLRVDPDTGSLSDVRVDLSPDGRVLTIRGQRVEDCDECVGRVRWYRFEIYFGPFEISIPLPGGVVVDREKITGSYKDGFLIVILPKVARAERSVVHTIPVTGE